MAILRHPEFAIIECQDGTYIVMRVGRYKLEGVSKELAYDYVRHRLVPDIHRAVLVESDGYSTDITREFTGERRRHWRAPKLPAAVRQRGAWMQDAIERNRAMLTGDPATVEGRG